MTGQKAQNYYAGPTRRAADASPIAKICGMRNACVEKLQDKPPGRAFTPVCYRSAEPPPHPAALPAPVILARKRSRTTTLSIVHLVLGLAPASQVKAEDPKDVRSRAFHGLGKSSSPG